jgi:hypothetical protein
MTLSPAAQAAWTAYETADCDPYFVDPRKAGLAAALRAAAEQIEDLYCESDVDDSNGVVFAMRHLVLIADELEGHA